MSKSTLYKKFSLLNLVWYKVPRMNGFNYWVVYPNPADNSISAEIGKTAMNSAASSFKMPQGNALTRFHRVRCSSAHKAPTPVHPPMLHPLGLLFDRTLVGANRFHVVS